MSCPRIPVLEHRLPPQHQKEDFHRIFYLRPNFTQEDDEAAVNQRERVFNSLINKWNLTYGFCPARDDPRGPASLGWWHDLSDCAGAAFMNWREMEYPPEDRDPTARYCIWIYLQLEQLELLLRGDLNASEKMSIEWDVAYTVNFAPPL
jgi:hypothetical protein